MPYTTARKRRKSSRKKLKLLRLSRSGKRKAKNVVFASALFVISAGFLGSIAVYRSFTKNFASAMSANSYDILSEDVYTFAFISSTNSFDIEPLILERNNFLIVDAKDKKLINIEIPLDFSVDQPGRYSIEEVSKSLALGMLSSGSGINDGIRYYEKTIKRIFGLSVDRFILTDYSIRQEWEDLVFDGSIKPFLDPGLIGKFEASLATNFSLSEIYNYHNFRASLKQNDIQKIDVSSVSEEELDSVIRDLTYDTYVSDRKESIAILNGTDIEGLATLGGRVVENIGGRVIAVGNTGKPYNESVVVADDKNSPTVHYLQRFFEIQEVLDKSEASSISENEIERADITVIIGLDIGNEL